MFTRQLIIALAFLGSVLGLSVYCLVTISEKDSKDYEQLVQSSSSSGKRLNSTQQRRHNVSKQMLTYRGDHRLETRLSSDQSELIIDRHFDKGDIVEHFLNVSCISQEELKENAQQIRKINAIAASYHYRSGILHAKNAAFSRYKLPGRVFIEPRAQDIPFMTGNAHSIELSIKEGSRFKAKKVDLRGSFK